MKLRSMRAVTIVAALSLVALPVQAQDTPSSVAFDGIGFAFDGTLGSSVNITQVPGQAADIDSPEGPDTPHLAFTLYGTKAEGSRTPRVGASDGVVRVYPAAGLAGNELAAAELASLTSLLADRPDLATFTAVTDDGSGATLPFLPVVGAAQAFRARAAYVDMPALSGVTYITGFRQDVAPFVAADFIYTFQGLTSDGLWYVSAVFSVRPSMFPDEIRARVANRIAERWAPYLRRTVATLDAATPESFTPSLTAVDALVASMTIDAIPAPEPVPLASPAPAASPAPSAAPAG